MVDRNSPEFLDYYASVLEREAAARAGQNVGWMIEGARQARDQAALVRIPSQADLFARKAEGEAA